MMTLKTTKGGSRRYCIMVNLEEYICGEKNTHKYVYDIQYLLVRAEVHTKAHLHSTHTILILQTTCTPTHARLHAHTHTPTCPPHTHRIHPLQW